jgi:hypothetical protein
MTTCSEFLFLFLFLGTNLSFFSWMKRLANVFEKKISANSTEFFSFLRVNFFFQFFENSGFFWGIFFSCEILILKFPFFKENFAQFSIE